MYNTQEGKCKICFEFSEKLHVDHDHETGVVRGLLCGNHNRMLGMAKENVLIFESAITYLRAYQERSFHVN